jgi:hypothetical protein
LTYSNIQNKRPKITGYEERERPKSSYLVGFKTIGAKAELLSDTKHNSLDKESYKELYRFIPL